MSLRRSIPLLITSLFLLAASPASVKTIRVTKVYTPELFGLARLSVNAAGTGGTIKNSYATFIWRGQRKGLTITGEMWQVAGTPINDRDTPTGPEYPAGRIAFVMQLTRSQDEFQGKIFFRGHWRKYCGGQDRIPTRCMLK